MTTPWSLSPFYLPAHESDTSKLGGTLIEGHLLSLSLSHGHLRVTDTTLSITGWIPCAQGLNLSLSFHFPLN